MMRGALVLDDVAPIRQAERGRRRRRRLVLLTTGAGGQTDWLNPFALRAVRALLEGPIVPAGGVSDGQALRAAEVLGNDLAYMGTKR